MTPFVSALFLEHISNLQIRLRFCGHDLEKNQTPRFGQGNKQRVHSTGLVGQHGRHATGLTFHLNDPMLFQNLMFRDALTKSSETELRLLSPNQSQETVLSHNLFSWMLDDNYKINQNQCVITLNYPVPLSKVRQSSISSISSLSPISSPPTYEVYHHIPTSQGTQCTTARMAWRRLLHESMAWHSSLLRKHRRLGSPWPPPPPSLTPCLGERSGARRDEVEMSKEQLGLESETSWEVFNLKFNYTLFLAWSWQFFSSRRHWDDVLTLARFPLRPPRPRQLHRHQGKPK